MELRHLTASAHALIREATEAPVGLPIDNGNGQVFPIADTWIPAPGVGQTLTERERAIAALMVDGRSNREIGEQLYLSPETVKAHVARLLRKLGAANRVEAVARLVRSEQATELAGGSLPAAG
jgi:DNA-binding NarL/FixJ family response regulator